MTEFPIGQAHPGLAASRSQAAFDIRYLWLAAGGVASMFAVGGRWDIAIAAWIAPIFLLRFVRRSPVLVGLGAVFLISLANALWWSISLNIRLQASTILFDVLLGMAFTLPYVVDRILADRLGLVGKLLIFPATIVACEFVVGTFSPLGTAYGLRAITQNGNLALMQLVSVTGPYGIGFLIGWLATSANLIWATPSWAAVRTPVTVFVGVMLTVLIGGGARLALDEGGARKPTVKIAGVTSSLATRQSVDAAFGEAGPPSTPAAFARADRGALRAAYTSVQDELFESTRVAARSGAQIVLWAETAATSLAEDRPALLQRASAVAREEKIYLNVAVGEPFARNETYMIDPSGRVAWHYRKNHPVPGMEPVPPTKNPVPTLQTPFGTLANVICFDADFPALARVAADIMIVPGLDWPEIGRTHTMEMASARAIENGYSLIRQDTTGHSAAFDRFGRVLASQDTTGPGRHMMMVDLPIRSGRTIYNRIGDVFAWLCLLGLAAGGVMALRSRSKMRPAL